MTLEINIDAKSFQMGFDAASADIEKLQADNLNLRDAVDIDNLHWLIAYLYMQNEIGRAEKLRTITNALASTPAQSLQDHDET